MRKRVVVVDDSSYQRTVIKNALTAAGFEIVGEAKNGHDAIDEIDEKQPDFVTMDQIMPGEITGVDAVRELVSAGNKAKFLMVSSVAQDSMIAEAKAAGVSQFLKKPYTEDELINALKSL